MTETGNNPNDEIANLHWLLTILQNIDVGLAVVDSNYRVQLWNGFMENYSRIHSSALLGKNLFENVPGLPEEWLKNKIKEVLMLSSPVTSSWEQRQTVFDLPSSRPFTGGSGHMYQDLSIIPLTSIDGSCSNVCIIVYNVTEAAVGKLRLEDANHQLRMLSITDGLTKLYNRAHWQECLEQEFRKYRRKTSDVTLMMFDIDHFKHVNDTYGHPAGDAVLRTVSGLLKKFVRNSDIAGRYGGEEFCVILMDATESAGRLVAERFRKLIEQQTVHYQDMVIKFTISLGVSQLTPEFATAKDWMISVDNSLYYSKEHGRNQVNVWSEIPHSDHLEAKN